jgi:ABC-type lipoprotein export system ATPase subunit
MVTHDREIALMADRIIELIDGRVCKSLRVREMGTDAARELLDKKVCLVP